MLGIKTEGQGGWDYFHHHSTLNINVKGSQNSYRFSISSARIFPNGTGEVNKTGSERIVIVSEFIEYTLKIKGMELM
ncbi:family 1 glycosylhydrolase [Clostridium sp. 1xD42-85]|uniref:family 1 glycosylhydrolase n=1 Tax=Clostridia TaxID=186801 RepID=UPI0018F77A7C|nr:family 1 glycosylhydrolase [Clostridium sp. 1xD42-85]